MSSKSIRTIDEALSKAQPMPRRFDSCGVDGNAIMSGAIAFRVCEYDYIVLSEVTLPWH